MVDVSVIALCAQVAMAMVGLYALRRRVYPWLDDGTHTRIVVEVWGPIALVMPLLFFLGRVGTTVTGIGWVPLAGPIVAGWIALAAVLIVGAMGLLAPVSMRAAMIWSAAGLLLFMLAAAHRLSVQLGQCALTAGAVLLWLNTPPAPGKNEAVHVSREQAAAGAGLLVALLAAIGQGIAILQIEGNLVRVSAGLALGYLTVGVCAATASGGSVAMRLGGWTTTFGVLLALGLLALLRMVPVVVEVLTGRIAAPSDNIIATGFGAFAPEAIALMLLGPAIPTAQSLPRGGQVALGVVILVAAAILIGWRLSGATG